MAYGANLVEGQLGAVSPAAGQLVDAYIVPTSNRAEARVVIANRGAATTFRVSHAKDGAADDPSQYLSYDTAIDANGSLATDKIVLSESDRIRVQSGSGSVTFNVNGSQERIVK